MHLFFVKTHVFVKKKNFLRFNVKFWLPQNEFCWQWKFYLNWSHTLKRIFSFHFNVLLWLFFSFFYLTRNEKIISFFAAFTMIRLSSWNKEQHVSISIACLFQIKKTLDKMNGTRIFSVFEHKHTYLNSWIFKR
jgi:hypothetical protein